jgi:peptidyl-prolyl cis-trans isomerase C
MRFASRAACLVAASATFLFAWPTEAQAPAADAPALDRTLVVARVDGQPITLGDLEKSIASVPPFALVRYGKTPTEIRKNYLEQVLVRDKLFEIHATKQAIDARPDVAARIRGILRRAVIDDVRADAKVDEIAKPEIEKYFAENIEKFTSPRRLGIYRILVATEAEARAILGDLGKEPDLKKWNDLARDKSLDKSSNMRSGNLGFLDKTGDSGQPDARFDPALFAAADGVKDGELVSSPVAEGDKFAVVWRRQEVRAVSRSIDAEAPSIRKAIADERVRTRMDKLLEGMRKELLSEYHPELTDMITVNEEAEVEKVKRPGVLPKTKRPARAKPVETPSGLR